MGEHELGLVWGAWMDEGQPHWAGDKDQGEEAYKLEGLTQISNDVLTTGFTNRLTWHLSHSRRVHSYHELSEIPMSPNGKGGLPLGGGIPGGYCMCCMYGPGIYVPGGPGGAIPGIIG